MRKTVFILIVVSVSFPSCRSLSCDTICAHNEVFSLKASQCQNTCWNRAFNETLRCRVSPGCVCKRGHLRHPETYECIPRQSCPIKTNHAQCPKNEVYTICTGPTMECERTCNNFEGASKKCACKTACTCKRGHARSSMTFQCIPVSSCEKCPAGFTYDKAHKRCSPNCTQLCPENETFTLCGSSCRELKCPLSENESSLVCAEECSAGCYCNNGYSRDLLTNICVLSHDCSQCPDYEVYQCGNPLCETTCTTLDEKCTKQPIRCEKKCYCMEDYVRAVEGSQCVSKLQCPVINRDVR